MKNLALNRLSRPLRPASLIARWAWFFADAVCYGLPVAGVNFFTADPNPVDPEHVWQFFTRKQPRLIARLIETYPPLALRRRIADRMLAQSHAAGIEYHYDLSNDFYRLFLDREFMFYSCADFHVADETIEQAQRNKANHILSLLEPAAGERVLELGCGWGAMLRHIRAHTGNQDNLFGYTLSQEQARFIAENFGFNVALEDFITANLGATAYDKIYSIGAMEHVRPEEILPLLRKLHSALKPGGRLVQQFFSLNGTDPLLTSLIGAQQFFPGSLLSLHCDHLRWAEQAGFQLTHDSTHDYRPTLRAWFDRLVENRKRAIELVGVQTTNKFLTFFPVSWEFFNRGEATLHRLVHVKR